MEHICTINHNKMTV